MVRVPSERISTIMRATTGGSSGRSASASGFFPLGWSSLTRFSKRWIPRLPVVGQALARFLSAPHVPVVARCLRDGRVTRRWKVRARVARLAVGAVVGDQNVLVLV